MYKRKILKFCLFGILCIGLFLTGCSKDTASIDESITSDLVDVDYTEVLSEEWIINQPVGILTQWSKSKHAKEGVSCDVCHGSDPQNLEKPTPTTCGVCHNQQAEEFAMSTHSTAIVHAMSKDSSIYNGVEVEYKWQAYPEGGPDKWGCANCHSVGVINDDGSLGDCSSCHGSHEFSLQQARSPETCNGCHSGPGHPQYESYIESRHGILWQSLGDTWDLSGSTEEFWARQEVEPIGAPTCSTCHMPGGSHNTANGKAHDLYGNRMEDYDEEVTFMVENSCNTCHTEEFAREWLGNANELAEYTLGRMREAKGMLEGLKKDGLIRPTMEITNAHPIAGQLSAVESLFFQVNMATNRARKGAYHMSSQWAGRQGWTDQSFGLMEFRSEVERLRTDAEREKRIQDLEELIKKAN
ncbi:MAG: hypothetical protein GX300_11090 [Tissierellia bacterium]|nr:hypothetical protein [Tissierellia bacterium]